MSQKIIESIDINTLIDNNINDFLSTEEDFKIVSESYMKSLLKDSQSINISLNAQEVYLKSDVVS